MRPQLGLEGHAYSPTILATIVTAGARLKSFGQAGIALRDVAGIAIGDRQIENLTEAIGNELAQQREQKRTQRRRRQLPIKVANPPEAVAVEIDGGRLATRASGCGPGVHEPAWKEYKAACLVRLHSTTHEDDPQSEPPACFHDPDYVARLVRQVRSHAAETTEEPAEEPLQEAAAADGPLAAETLASGPSADGSARRAGPVRLLRTCVATVQNSHAFGPMVAAEAQERGFYAAPRRAFVGDGSHYNWSIHDAYFPDFVPVTDFIHVLDYVHAAAFAVGADPPQGWSLYVAWMTACWQGRVGAVLEALRGWQGRLGPPPQDGDEQDPRRVVARSQTYLENNAPRMQYPRYRRLGLPVTSSLVESLIGQFNERVKSKEKYWNRPEAAEAILQVRAAALSEDDRLETYILNRPGNPYRRHNPAPRGARRAG